MEIISQGIKERKAGKEGEEMAQTIAEYFVEQGEKCGALKAKRADVLKIMQIRFGDIPESVVKQVKTIRSLSRLDALLEKAAIASSISEIEMS
jgi:hypothetical protein